MKQEYSAGVVVYYPGTKGREYILIYSNVTRYWGFAKGGIEQGETKQKAAQREVKEETGLDITIDDGFQHTSSYSFRDKQRNLIRKTVYFFVGRAHAKHVQLSHEHTDFIWLSYHDALAQITYDNDRTVFEEAEAFLKRKTGHN